MKKYLLIILVLIFTYHGKSQCTFGNYPTTYTISGGLTNGAWIAQKYNQPSTATVTGLGLKAINSFAWPFQMAIFTDVGNAPGNLVAISNTVASMVSGSNTVTVPSTTIAAGNYWVMGIYGNSGAPIAYQSGTATVSYTTGTLGTPPPNMTAWNTGNYNLGYWAIINTPVIGATTTNSVLCVGQTATLTANGALTYTWNPGGTGTSISVSPSVTANYTITATNVQGCMNSSVFTQTVSTCAGINQLGVGSPELVVYPNPFNNKITIVSSGSKQLVQIFNALGSLVRETIIENEKTEMDLMTLTSGIYFIKMGSVTRKIIKE